MPKVSEMKIVELLPELSSERTCKTIRDLWGILTIMEKTNIGKTESEVVVYALLEMNLRIDELTEKLIEAKSRALPDDFLDKNRRITYSVEELEDAKSK